MLVASITTQRSGSKLLGSCFNQGTVVRSFGEVFNPDASHALGAFTAFVETLSRDLRKRGSDAVLDEYFNGFKFVHGIVHFDLMFNQLEIPCLSWNPYEDQFAYGYLRMKRSVVISLERDTRDSYVSGKYLQLTAAENAHHFPGSQRAERTERFVLDIDDYRRYRQAVMAHRQRLYDAMRGYDYFVKLGYEELSRRSRLPEEILDVICRAAKEHCIRVNRDMMQLLPPPIVPTNVSYRDVFQNFDELDRDEPARDTP